MGTPLHQNHRPRLTMTYSPLATPSATVAALKRHRLHTKKFLGQHFLVDDNVIGRILALADLKGDETVLEVGPGIGTLTVALCEAAGAVVAVERDEGLGAVLAETTGSYERLAVIHADAATVDPALLCEPFGEPVALVANLPYGVAATVVLRCFELMPSIRSATVMVQAEVADRMSASPGTKDYGAYTVKLRLHAHPTGKFGVAPGCFMPPPRVDSTVIRLERPGVGAQLDPETLAWAARLANAAFAQRRKTVRNSMRAASGLPGDQLDAVLASAGVDGSVRAETLAPEMFVAMAQACRTAGITPRLA